MSCIIVSMLIGIYKLKTDDHRWVDGARSRWKSGWLGWSCKMGLPSKMVIYGKFCHFMPDVRLTRFTHVQKLGNFAFLWPQIGLKLGVVSIGVEMATVVRYIIFRLQVR